MSGVNKVILLGNVGKDPEVRTFQNGGRVCSFSVATSESWKDKASCERKERTEWHKISITNDALVGIVEKYVRKGSKVYLEGQLETRKYEKDGRDMYTTEIVLRPYRGEIVLLDSRQSDTQETAHKPENETQAPVNALEDEIPF